MTNCNRAFAETGDPAAGGAVVKALLALERYDEVLAWEDRLRGTQAEADYWKRAGFVYWSRGDLKRAKEAYQTELELHLVATDPQAAARSAYQLHLLAWQNSELRQALDYARQTYDQAQIAGERDMQSLALEALARLLFDVGDLAGAERAIEASAEISPDQAPPPERLNQQGLIRFHEGRPALARDLFETALELPAPDRGASFYRSLHLNLASTYLMLDELDRAQEHLEAAWEHVEPDTAEPTSLLYYQARLHHRVERYQESLTALGRALDREPIPGWRWRLLFQRGLCEEALGRLDAAREAYEDSIQVLEAMRHSLELNEFKAWHLTEKRKPYEALFRLQAGAGDARHALATLERAKARTFLDAFTLAAATEGAAPGRAMEAASQRLDALQVLLPAMSESPAVAPRSVDQLLDDLGERCVLAYFAAGGELWLVRVKGSGIGLWRLEASADEMRRHVDRALARPVEEEEAAELGRLLLPDAALPEPGSTLYLVTDDVLGRLPFAALRRHGRYLVEDYDLTYVPSPGTLAALLEARRLGRLNYTAEATVLGDPQRDLPAAAHEARDVAQGLGVLPLLGEAATVDRMLAASQAPVLHLAAHTGLGPRGPWLALADGEVSAERIIQERVAPGLVVLSSCASAARPQRGKGMWGSLGAAFLAAGSQAVLASLWSIEDEVARRFALSFYTEGGRSSPTASLARTQRASIAAGAAPSAWASFVLFGADPTSDE